MASVQVARRKLFLTHTPGVDMAPGGGPTPPGGGSWTVEFTVEFDATYLDKTLNGNNAFPGAVLSWSSDLLFFGQEVLVAQKSGGAHDEFQFGLAYTNETDFRFGPVLTPGQVYAVSVTESPVNNYTEVSIDGAGPYYNDTTDIYLSGEADWNAMNFGQWDGPSDQDGHKYMDDIVVNAGLLYPGFGNGDIIAGEDFSGSLPGQFDSLTDPDGRLAIVSSRLKWTGGTSSVDDAYLTKAVA